MEDYFKNNIIKHISPGPVLFWQVNIYFQDIPFGL